MPETHRDRIVAQGSAVRNLVISDYDVICMCKRFVSDETPCQKPVLALPNAFLQRLPGDLPSTTRPLNPLSVDRRKNWADLSKALLSSRGKDPSLIRRSVQYLLAAARGLSTAQGGPSPLRWHSESHEDRLVRLQDAPATSFLKLYPVVKFKATLKR